MTADEAAPLLGITPHSVRTFIRRGMIFATKQGRSWYITEGEVARYNRERNPPHGLKGRKMTEEQRRNLSAARLANNPMRGKRHTEETRAKMSAHQSKQPRGAQSHAWKGGRVLSRVGYVLIYKPDHPNAVLLYVLEHRLVMEAALGRYLTDDEVVHHKNGIITDNRLENLQVMTKSEHMRHHRLINPTLPGLRKKR